MKFTKLFLILTLLSVNVFADGDLPGGGRSCSADKTCIVSNSDSNEKGSSGNYLTSLLVKFDFWNLFN